MKTIGKRIPANRPPGDYVARCAICSANFYRSELRFDGERKLICKYEGNGRDGATLSKDNARAARRRFTSYKHDGGGYTTSQ